MSRKLTDAEVNSVISLKDNDITKELFMLWFGRDEETGTSKFQPNDWFELRKGMISCFKETTPIKTTIGRFIFNKFLNEGVFGDKLPYFNEEKEMDFDKLVVVKFIEGVFPMKLNSLYQTKKAWIECTPTEIIVPGLSFNILAENPIVIKRKKELYKQYEKEIKAGDINVSKKIEDELCDLARKLNKDDPSMRLYNLKKPSFSNNYKNMCVMVGAQRDNDGDGFHISMNNYEEGIPKDEYDNYADQLVGGTYARSVATKDGGYLVKKSNAALQNETCNTDINSDCGTSLTMKVELTDYNIKMYYWRFIKDGNKYIQLTPLNADSYKNKTVNMRSVMFCKGKSYCAKCAGTLYPSLNIKNVGLTCSDAPSKLLNNSMKSFHDATIKITSINFEDYFSDY